MAKNKIVRPLTTLDFVDDFNELCVEVSGVARHFICLGEETCWGFGESASACITSASACITCFLPSRPLVIVVDVNVEFVSIVADGEAPDRVWVSRADAFWIRQEVASEIFPVSPAGALSPRRPHDLIFPSKTEEIHSIFSACGRAFVLYFTAYVLPWLNFIIDDSEMRNGICVNLITSSDCKTVYVSLIARNALKRRAKKASFCASTLLPNSVDSNIVAPPHLLMSC